MAATTSLETHHSNRLYWVWVGALVVAFAIGLVAMSQVLLRGLQVTDLSDQVPWGLWITLDLYAIELGSGAFSFYAAVYLFRIKRLEVLARPATPLPSVSSSRVSRPSPSASRSRKFARPSAS